LKVFPKPTLNSFHTVVKVKVRRQGHRNFIPYCSSQIVSSSIFIKTGACECTSLSGKVQLHHDKWILLKLPRSRSRSN